MTGWMQRQAYRRTVVGEQVQAGDRVTVSLGNAELREYGAGTPEYMKLVKKVAGSPAGVKVLAVRGDVADIAEDTPVGAVIGTVSVPLSALKHEQFGFMTAIGSVPGGWEIMPDAFDPGAWNIFFKGDLEYVGSADQALVWLKGRADQNDPVNIRNRAGQSSGVMPVGQVRLTDFIESRLRQEQDTEWEIGLNADGSWSVLEDGVWHRNFPSKPEAIAYIRREGHPSDIVVVHTPKEITSYTLDDPALSEGLKHEQTERMRALWDLGFSSNEAAAIIDFHDHARATEEGFRSWLDSEWPEKSDDVIDAVITLFQGRESLKREARDFKGQEISVGDTVMVTAAISPTLPKGPPTHWQGRYGRITAIYPTGVAIDSMGDMITLPAEALLLASEMER